MKGSAFDISPIKGTGANPAIPPSSSPASMGRKSSATSPTRNGSNVKYEMPEVDELEDEDQGFDLTRGFQSIGSYHAPASNGLTVTGAINGHS